MSDNGTHSDMELPKKYEVAFVKPELVKIIENRRKQQARQLAAWQEAADEGSTEAQLQMGINCFYGINGVDEDPERAFQYFDSAEETPEVLYWRGLCYLNGKGVETDVDEAFRLFQESAEGNFAPAVTAEAACYETGTGIEKDTDRALELYRRADELEDPSAPFFLGNLYALGDILEKNPEKAKELMERCKQLMKEKSEADAKPDKAEN